MTSPHAAFDRADLERSIGSRFLIRARRHAGRTAVSSGGRNVSYAELQRLSNRFGGIIASRGGPQPEAVALLLGQGVDLIAAILGILGAGKFYLGLDPHRPRAILAAMLADSGARLVVTDEAHAALARSVAPAAAEILIAESVLQDGNDVPLAQQVSPDAAAYLFYTSGSTGRPKGVIDCHRNVLHNIMRYTNTLRIGPEDRLSLLQSSSYSGSVSSLFAALLNGACVCPYDPRQGSSADLARWVGRERITIYHSTPTIFRSFLTEDRTFPDVRIVRLEGEQAASHDVELFRRHFGPASVLVNGFGTTETGLVRQYFVTPDTELVGAVLPVGQQVEDMEVRIVGQDGRALPCGEIGEIAVTSAYLAVGYWNRPDLTRERFGQEHRPGLVRTYRTGDIGRIDGQGHLVHLGRNDDRVKIRGVAVDTAEVEGAILALALARDAAVIATEDARRGSRLAAYYVPRSWPGPTVSELRRSMTASVPSPMIPSSWIRVAELPRNANGKIDRRSLPLPGDDRPILDTPYARSASPVERLLAGIWESLLQIRPVGRHDDFFDLGGDSLLALEMLAEVERALEVDLPASALLGGATIAGIAGRLVSGRSPADKPIVVLRSEGPRSPLFYLHGDYLSGGLYCLKLGTLLSPDQPLYVLPPCGSNGGPVPSTYGEMADIHLRAIRAHAPDGPILLGGTCNGGLVAYEIARRLEAEGRHVDLLALFASSAANVRLRPLAWWSERLGVWLGQSPERRRARLARLRERVFRLGRIPPGRRWLHVLARGGRVPAEVVLWLRSARGAPQRLAGGTASVDARTNPLADAYQRIDLEYCPERYGGRVTLLWPGEDPDSPERAAADWRRVACEVEIEVIPGTHMDGITKNLHLLGAALERRLSALGPAGASNAHHAPD